MFQFTDPIIHFGSIEWEMFRIFVNNSGNYFEEF